MTDIRDVRLPHMMGGSLNVLQLAQGIAQAIDGMQSADSEEDFLQRKERARDLSQTLNSKLRRLHFDMPNGSATA